MYKALPLRAKDLQYYKKELLKYREFNDLNENLYDRYMKSSLFNKIQYRSGTRIICYHEDPVLILWSETRNYNVKMRSIVPLKSFAELKTQPLAQVMDAFLESLPIHLDIHQFEYTTIDNEENHILLTEMGFTYRKGLLRMKRKLDLPPKVSREVEIKRFQIEDVKARVELQNQIFDNKYRVPLSVTDVLLEISKRTYIPELSFFLVEEGQYVGYGQINRQEDCYFLVNFGIAPDFRGKGRSRDFLYAILSRAKELDIQEIYLDVNEDNFRAKELYLSSGFQEEKSTCTWLYYIK
ncbi:MAG TPA: hypothetical protein DEF30_06495 [Proteiniclasticum sp.]|uniref:GNAT family N-acetyltransferase n=1 Tax=Proteiniclasticum sp. TaxID=2053595 RepID=UPI000E9B72B6|nr:GNAT family N-acetyltransferase [Proteiniclasticum sp.]HBW13450.1 hypothetical protein [Proteiniclasticum sp.]